MLVISGAHFVEKNCKESLGSFCSIDVCSEHKEKGSTYNKQASEHFVTDFASFF